MLMEHEVGDCGEGILFWNQMVGMYLKNFGHITPWNKAHSSLSKCLLWKENVVEVFGRECHALGCT